MTKCDYCGAELQGILQHASHMCPRMREGNKLYFIGTREVPRGQWEAFNKAMQAAHLEQYGDKKTTLHLPSGYWG